MKNKIIIVLVALGILMAAIIEGILENSDTLGENYKSNNSKVIDTNKLETVKPNKKVAVVTEKLISPNKENELLADKAKKLIIEKEAELKIKGMADMLDILKSIDPIVEVYELNKVNPDKIISTHIFNKDKSKILVVYEDKSINGNWVYVHGSVKVIKN